MNNYRYFGHYEMFVGLQEPARSFDCRLSPNPSPDGMVGLEVTDEGIQPQRFTLFDLNGRRLLSQPLSGANLEQINLGSLPSGQYILEILARGGKKTALPVQIR